MGVTGLGVLAVAAVALNVKTDGGNLRDFVAGMLVPVVLGVLGVTVVAALRRSRQARPEHDP